MINIFKGNYKSYLILPAILFVIFLFFIFVTPQVPAGIDLKGGNMVIVRADKQLDSEKLDAILTANYGLTDLQVTSISGPTGHGATIQYAEYPTLANAKRELKEAKKVFEENPEQAKTHIKNCENLLTQLVQIQLYGEIEDQLDTLTDAVVDAEEAFKNSLQATITKEFQLGSQLKIQSKEVNPILGEAFWNLAITVALVGFALVVLIIFIFFREVVPSLAVLGAVVFDIAGALALMAIFRIPLSLSTIPALLMLIGYSVDTDIMLTTRLLKRREKDHREQCADAMKTGLTMTFTTIAALSSMLILSYYAQVIVIFEIAAVLFFGLFADVISTWMMNAPVLLWYVEEKK